MRKFWQAVLFCTALLIAAPLAHAQTSPTQPRSTSTSPAFTGVAPTLPSGGGAAAPVTPTESRETRATAPKETPKETATATSTSTAPGVVTYVEVDKWRHLDAFTLLMIMVAAIAAIVLIYYVFLRKRAD